MNYALPRMGIAHSAVSSAGFFRTVTVHASSLQTRSRPRPRVQDETMQALSDPVKACILQRIVRGDPLSRIATSVQANFHIEIDSGQVLACWRESNAPSTPTGPRQNARTPTEWRTHARTHG